MQVSNPASTIVNTHSTSCKNMEIKELKALKEHAEVNGFRQSLCWARGSIEALKDVLGLIDEVYYGCEDRVTLADIEDECKGVVLR